MADSSDGETISLFYSFEIAGAIREEKQTEKQKKDLKDPFFITY